MSTEQIVTDLIDITRRLANLIRQENQALQEKQPRVLSETLGEKEHLTADYESRMHQLQGQPDLLNTIGEDRMAQLKSATRQFQDALEEHRRLVQTTKSVTERMLKAITKEVSKRQNPVSTYDNHAGMQSRVMGNNTSVGVNLAVNQTI